MAQEEVIITVNMPAGLVEQATGMATEGTIPKISAEAIAEALIASDPVAKKELEVEQKKAAKLLKERNREEERLWKEMLQKEKAEEAQWQRMLKAERNEHIAWSKMLVKEEEDNYRAAIKAADDKYKHDLKVAKEKEKADKLVQKAAEKAAKALEQEAKDLENADIAKLTHREKRLRQDALDEQAKRKKELSEADKALKDEVDRLAAGYKRRAQEEEAESKKKGKEKLSPSDQLDLERLIKQNKRGYNEEMGTKSDPAAQESPSVVGDFLTRMGSGLAGHHGGLRSLLGASLKGLGGSIGGGAGGAAGGGGAAAAGAAAGAPLGPLGIAAGVVIGKIAGDTIAKSAEILVDAAKMIYNSGEKFTEAGSAYSSVLQGATQGRTLRQMEFDMGLDRYGGSLGRFYAAQTDLEIKSQEAIIKIFELLEPAMTTGLVVITDLLTAANGTYEITKGLAAANQETLARLLANLAGATGVKLSEAIMDRLNRAANLAKGDESRGLANMVGFLGLAGDPFKGGKPQFQGGKNFAALNAELLERGFDKMGF